MAFAWYIPVTLNNSGSPFALGSYQVPIDLNSTWASDIFAKARSDGADIAIYDSTGTTLQNFRLEYYTPGSSKGRLWLNVNSLAIGSSATYQIQYNDPARSVSLGSFDATFQKLQLADIGSGNVAALFQYDDGSGSTPVDATGVYSASSTVNGGTPTWLGHAGGCWPGYQGSAAQNGTHFASGSAIHFNGSEAHLITGLMDTWPAAGEIGVWFCPDTTINNTTTGFPHLWSKVNAGPNNTSPWTAALACYFNTDGTLSVDHYYATGVETIRSQTNSWAAGVWHLAQVRWNLTKIGIWVDGTLEACLRTNQGSGNGQTGSGAANPFAFGALWQGNASLQYQSPSPQQAFTGYLYQAYVLKVEPSSDFSAAVLNWRKYVSGMGANSRLTKRGTVLPQGASGWNGALQIEPSQIIVGAKKRIYTTGYTTATADSLGVFESTDGITYTTPAGVTNPVIATGHGSNAIFNSTDSKYYWFYVKAPSGGTSAALYYQTSTDGLSWPGPETAVSGMSVSALAQSWISNNCDNPWVFFDTNVNKWRMYFGGENSSQVWSTGLFESTSLTGGGTWAPPAGKTNPISITYYGANSSVSLQWVYIMPDGSYVGVAHASTSGFGPNFGQHYKSADGWTWTRYPAAFLNLGNENFTATGIDGKSGPADQLADFRVDFFNSQTQVDFDVDRNDNLWNGQQGRIDSAYYGSTVASLFTDYPTQSAGSPTQIGTTLALAALSAAWTNPSLSFSSSLALAQEAAAWTSPALVQTLALALGQQAAAWTNPGITIPGSSLNLAAQAAAFSNPSLLSPSLALGLAAESAGWSNPALNASYAVALAAESAGWSNPAITFASSGGSALSLPAEVATFTVNDLALFFCPTILKPYLGTESCVISDTEQVTLYRKLADGVFDVGTNVGQALRLEIGKSQAIGAHGAKVVNRLNWILWANQAGAGIKDGDVIQDLYGVRWVIEKTHVQAWGQRYLVETVQAR